MKLNDFRVVAGVVGLIVLFAVFNFVMPACADEPRIIGIWENNNSKENYKILLAEEEDEIVLVKKFEGGIMIRQVVIESQLAVGMVYTPEDESYKDYFIIDQAGNLQVWDILGLQMTMPESK